jgi:hypothetical protein
MATLSVIAGSMATLSVIAGSMTSAGALCREQLSV